MLKFYQIPIVERTIGTRDSSLINLLKEKYPALYRREEVRISLQYGSNDPKLTESQIIEMVEDYNHQTILLYKIYDLPLNILAIQEDDGPLREYITKTELTSTDDSILRKREISPNYIQGYIEVAEDHARSITSLFESTSEKVVKIPPIA